MRNFSIVLIAGLFILQGCAGPAVVLREDAGALAEVTKQTVSQVREFYSEQSARRLNYYLSLVAMDPNCRAEPTILVMPSNIDGEAFRCVTDDIRIKCQTTDIVNNRICNFRVIELLPRSDVYQYALTFVDALADYQVLLANIAKQETFDTGAELVSLRERLINLQSELTKLVQDLEILPQNVASEVVGDQLTAIGGFLDVIREGSAAQEALSNLKDGMRAHGSVFESSLGQLAHRYRNVDLAGKLLVERNVLEERRRKYNDLVVQGKAAQLSPAVRKAKLVEILEADRQRNEYAARPDPLASAIDSLRISEARLRAAVLDDKLSAAQRHRIAQANTSELKAIFRAISGVVQIFH